MVRLKVDVGKVLPQMQYNVSIPYGSIKRFTSTDGGVPSGVSIPYGSIKSEAAATVIEPLASFNSLWFD